MAYRYVDLVSSKTGVASFARRLGSTVAAAVMAGLLVGGSMRAARAADDDCLMGHYAQFWDPSIRKVTKTNTKLSPADAKLFIQRLDQVPFQANLPADGSITVRLLVHKTNGRRLALAIDKTDCIRGYGIVADDLLDYLLHGKSLPLRFVSGQDS